MLTIIESVAARVEDRNNTDLSYEDYVDLLADVKIDGIKSSYIYITDADGNMLYHPTKEKVGKKVENSVINGVVKDLQSGKEIKSTLVTYDFKGVKKCAAYTLLGNDHIIVITADEAQILHGVYRVRNVGIFLVLATIVTASIISIIFSKRLAKPLVSLSGIIEEIADGNMHVDFSNIKKTNDEIGVITEKMQNMTSSLADIVEVINNASISVHNNSGELLETSNQTVSANNEIFNAVEDVAEGATQMAISISNINESIETMNEETNVIDSSVTDIKNQTGTVMNSSRKMSQMMHNMKKNSEKMSQAVTAIANRISQVNMVVEEVVGILLAIESISEQTSLLSLNASIEAARAGDAGRGFAVVADEIRLLSENTATELNNIKEIILKLVDECEHCKAESILVVEDNTATNAEINSVLKEFLELDAQIDIAAKKADDVKDRVSSVVELNVSISKSSHELTDVSSANAAAAQQMNANIEELNEMMGGVADMSNIMATQAEELNKALSYFK